MIAFDSNTKQRGPEFCTATVVLLLLLWKAPSYLPHLLLSKYNDILCFLWCLKGEVTLQHFDPFLIVQIMIFGAH